MLELKHIRKTYRLGEHEVQALRDVSFRIDDGDYVAIMGPSGSGKSTLMHLLGLLDVPDAGSYLVDGREVARLDEDELADLRRETFGFVFQQFHLLSRMTAEENVALPLLYAPGMPEGAPATVGLERLGLGDRLRHRPNQLSGGQQQRVAIARALINGPRIVLADEPTGNLDSVNEREILALLRELNEQGHTVIVVTHEEEVGRQARRLIRMRDGQIQSDERLQSLSSQKVSVTFREPELPKCNGYLSGVRHGVSEAREYLRQGMRTLLGNKVRSALSTLGILMGVAAVVAMLALGRGAQKEVESQIAALGSNLLVLRSGAIRVKTVSQEEGAVTRIRLEDVASLKERVALIKEASPTVEGKIQATYENRNWQTRILGTGPSYGRIRAADPTIGRFFTAEEARQRARVAVLGTKVSRELFGKRSPVGERIRLNRVSFQVIGLLPEKGSSGWKNQDDVILVPVSTAMRRILGKDYVDAVDLEVTDPKRMREAQYRILNVMHSRHRLGASQGQVPFEIQNLAEVQEALSDTSRTLSLLLASIAVISLLVGGIGIMNIMLVSVTERTAEIGLRKAVGATRQDILFQFLAEAVVVTAVGGVAGIVLGAVGTAFVGAVTGWATSISLGSVALAFFFSVSIGVLFGLYPARRASLLPPIVALRRE